MSDIANSKKKISRKENVLEVKEICVNCEEPLALDQRFCSHCGGKRIYNRITWRNLLEDFFDRFLSIENTFLKTFIALFTKPEDVINGYIYGMRKKYIPAFNYFAIALTVAGVFAFVIKNWFIEDLVAAQKNLYSESLNTIGGEAFIRDYLLWVTDHMTIVYFAIIPFLALLSRAIFWNYKHVNLTEHFVIYLYAYCHIAMCSSIIQLLIAWNNTLYQIYSTLVTFIMIFYIAYVLKRVFKLTMENIILKTLLLVGFFFSITIAIALAGIVYAIVTKVRGGEPDNPIEQTFNAGFEKGKQQSKDRAAKEKRLQDSLDARTLELRPDAFKDSLNR